MHLWTMLPNPILPYSPPLLSMFARNTRLLRALLPVFSLCSMSNYGFAPLIEPSPWKQRPCPITCGSSIPRDVISNEFEESIRGRMCYMADDPRLLVTRTMRRLWRRHEVCGFVEANLFVHDDSAFSRLARRLNDPVLRATLSKLNWRLSSNCFSY